MSEPPGASTAWGAALLLLLVAGPCHASQLLIGAAHTNITPDKPVALSGQFRTRIAKVVDTPCTATALALESRDGDKVLDQAIMVSCDLIAIRDGIQAKFRERVKSRLPGFDIRKLFLNATHTHTAPVMREGAYAIPKEGVVQPSEFVEFLCDRLSDAVVAAWESRKPGGVSHTLGHAVVGHNRRVVYENGRAQMYGSTDRADFRCVEGYEDHGVDMLFFWDQAGKLKAIAINLACPAQEVGGGSHVDADFWHEVRQLLYTRHSKDLFVLGWCGAAGDQSPRVMWNKRAEENMRRRRRISRKQEIARRIVAAVDDTLAIARKTIRTDLPLVHRVEDITLPMRMVTDKEFAAAKARYDALAKKKKPTPVDRIHMIRLKQRVTDRYETQKTQGHYGMELHVIRLGDVAIATNPFELYVDYGVQIKARSKAVQTFVIQLACNSGMYLPTARAIGGGGYSAEVVSNYVGPEGGKALVNHTVKTINALWAAKDK